MKSAVNLPSQTCNRAAPPTTRGSRINGLPDYQSLMLPVLQTFALVRRFPSPKLEARRSQIEAVRRRVGRKTAQRCAGTFANRVGWAVTI